MTWAAFRPTIEDVARGAQTFEAPAETYDRHVGRYTPSLARAHVRLLDIPWRNDVLEVGCGPDRRGRRAGIAGRVFTPLLALALFRTPVPAAAWAGVGLSLVGLALISGMPGGSVAGNLLVLANALAQSFQIVAMERFAPRYDARALTFVQMSVSCAAFVVIALAAGQVEAPDDAQTWYALVVTGVFAGALGYLVATWVQSRETAARTALVFTLEAPFAALFGVLLLSENLGWAGWTGCGVMLAGILLAEPAAASVLRRLVPARS